MSRKTENGVLPKGWRRVSLGEVCSIDKRTLSPQTTDDYCFDYIALSDIDRGSLLQMQKYKFSEAPSRARRVVKRGDVLLGTVRPNLQGFYVFKDEVKDCIVSTGFAVLTPKFDLLDSVYLFQLLFSHQMLATYHAVNVGSNYPAINSSDISNFKILVPPLREQKVIASILETWDTAIEKTEALIAAKEKQFGWLVRCLMKTSKKNWSQSLLKHIAKIKKGQQINRNTLSAFSDYPVWNGGITPSGYTEKYNTNENTITISEGGNSCGFVNLSPEKFWLGGHCYALEELNEGIILDFLYFYLKAQEPQIMKLRVGSGLPNIQRVAIEKLEIKYPNLQEQKHIAETLNTARKEIGILKALVERYRTQKRGLMQKLLTGKWRVKT